MQKEIMSSYKELKDFGSKHQFCDVLEMLNVPMDLPLFEVPLNFNDKVENFCSEKLYKLVRKEIESTGKEETSIGREVCNKDSWNKEIFISSHNVKLFYVSEDYRYSNDVGRVFMVDGYYIYDEYTINEMPFHRLYYINNSDVDDSYVSDSFNYICGLAARDYKVNPDYSRKIDRYINCEENKHFITFDTIDKAVGSCYGADLLASGSNGSLDYKLYYVCDDNRLLEYKLALYNGYYLQVENKDNFDKVFFFGEDFEYSLDFIRKIKKI